MKFRLDFNKYTIKDRNYEEKAEAEPGEDYVVKSMGAFGRWQAVVCVVASMSRLIAMWNIFSILFLTPETKFVCKDYILSPEESQCYDTCSEYELRPEVFNKTLTSEFFLVCKRGWMASFTQTVLMFGVVLGVAMFGWISDRFGRSRALVLSAIMAVIFMFGASFAPTYWTFTILRFFVGLTSGGIMSITAVYCLEMVGPQYREMAGSVALTPDCLAETSLALFAYFATTWNIFLLEFGAVSIALTILLLFLPETPRWLMANGKGHKAVEIMTKAAKFNKTCTSSIKDNVDKGLKDMHLKEDESQNLTYLELFKTTALAKITMSSITIWFVTGVCYYGLSQYITGLGLNIFAVVAIMGVLQIPMAPLATVIVKVYGRKLPMICSYVIIGVTMIILLVLPEHSGISPVFGIIGTLSSFLNFCILYVYVIELYPTQIRNMGFSLSSSGSKIGAMLAPFVASIHPRWVPSLIFAIIPFIAAAICLLLPETKGRKLRDTVNE